MTWGEWAYGGWGVANGMKSSAVIKCSGQREDGSAPAPGARWVVPYADKCVALTPGERPSRHRLKQYLHSFIHGLKSPLQQQKLTVARLSPSGWQWKFDNELCSRFPCAKLPGTKKGIACFGGWTVPVNINKLFHISVINRNWFQICFFKIDFSACCHIILRKKKYYRSYWWPLRTGNKVSKHCLVLRTEQKYSSTIFSGVIFHCVKSNSRKHPLETLRHNKLN